MDAINPSNLDQFARQYRWAGGRLSRVRFARQRGALHIDVVVRVHSAIKDLGTGARPVKLRLRFVDVEECRFQKRPAQGLEKIKDVKFGFFDGLFYVNFDAWSLGPGERPALHDFRGSEAYVAAKDLLWEELSKPD
jgi:hypothetical protein